MRKRRATTGEREALLRVKHGLLTQQTCGVGLIAILYLLFNIVSFYDVPIHIHTHAHPDLMPEIHKMSVCKHTHANTHPYCMIIYTKYLGRFTSSVKRKERL